MWVKNDAKDMKRFFLILSAVLSLGAVRAHAADWQPLSKVVADRAEYFIDMDSVKIRQGNPSAYVLTNYNRPRDGVASVSTLYAVDCSKRTIVQLGGSNFPEHYAQGTALSQFIGRNSTQQPVQAGTLGEKILREICATQGQ